MRDSGECTETTELYFWYWGCTTTTLLDLLLYDVHRIDMMNGNILFYSARGLYITLPIHPSAARVQSHMW